MRIRRAGGLRSSIKGAMRKRRRRGSRRRISRLAGLLGRSLVGLPTEVLGRRLALWLWAIFGVTLAELLRRLLEYFGSSGPSDRP